MNALAITEVAESRFLITDAQEIDREERLGKEIFNDRLSYRNPVGWDRMWARQNNGVRMWAGSFSVNRFDYSEDIKIQTEQNEDAAFAFRQSRREDYLEQREEREIRASYRIMAPLRAAILADGGTFKEYGDLGWSLAFEPSQEKRIEFAYWSVDHYYEQKKSDAMDRRSRLGGTTKLLINWQFDSGWTVEGEIEDDLPVRWHRDSRGYSYNYARRLYRLRIATPVQPTSWQLFFAADHERKSESKRFLDAAVMPVRMKSVNRQATQVEFGAVHIGGNLFADKLASEASNDHELSVGIIGIARDAKYAFEAGPDIGDLPTDRNMIDSQSPDKVQRREGAIYATLNRPLLSSKHHRWQTGVYTNAVEIDEGPKDSSVEVKTQLAWEYRYSERAGALFNSTWDVDQLVHDAPFRERPFRPWGGGSIHFIATF